MYVHDSRVPDALADRAALVARSCYALEARKTANLVARIYNAALADQGLEVAQFSTLCAIAMGRAESITMLARALGVDRSTLVRNLERLVRQGFVAGVPEGRRVRHVLTARGAAALERAFGRWQVAQDRLASAAGTASAEDPRAAMARLRRAVRSLDPVWKGA